MLLSEISDCFHSPLFRIMPVGDNPLVMVSKSFIPNPKQKQAIEHTTGPMLVLAGAGTGKTSVLVERIAFLIENHHARPDEILAITFTENAAQEMKQRVAKRRGRKAAITASDFHAPAGRKQSRYFRHADQQSSWPAESRHGAVAKGAQAGALCPD